MAAISPPLLEAMQQLSSLLISEESLETVLQRVAKLMESAVEGVEAAGITVVSEDGHVVNGFRASTAGYSHTKAEELDYAQFETKEGPCLEAIKQRAVFIIEDLEDDHRWPLFRERALPIGLRSSLSVPLLVGGGALGALNLYSFKPRSFDEHGADSAQVLAGGAAVTVSNMQAFVGAVQQSDNLTKAMESRATIEQAKGMIMLQRHCGPDEAFKTLVAASQARNEKLREIATEIVETAARGELPEADEAYAHA